MFVLDLTSLRTNATFLNVTGLRPYISYFVRIQAVNVFGGGAYSDGSNMATQGKYKTNSPVNINNSSLYAGTIPTQLAAPTVTQSGILKYLITAQLQ